MVSDAIKTSVIQFARSILCGQSPDEQLTPIFIQQYLPPKITHHARKHEAKRKKLFDPSKLEEIPNNLFIIISDWLEKNPGFDQLSDNDLFQKIEDQVTSYLKRPSNFTDFSYTDLHDQATSYDAEDFPPDQELHSLATDDFEGEEEKDIIDQPALERFKEMLHKHPELMTDQIKRECRVSEIREWLIATFPTITAFRFLCDGNKAFMSQFQRGDLSTEGNKVSWEIVRKELIYIETFDRMDLKTGQELEQTKNKLKYEAIRRGEKSVDNRELDRRYDEQYESRSSKFGYPKPTKEARLTNNNDEINAYFEVFAPLYYAIQKRQLGKI